ncbi:bifunctional alpha,alpha-trehalose-phosphate synthase (UDP-forming)/trehalose-phosphatase [Desulfosporosinus fructosivorans]|uniref:Bifunctional alpha,alpha-trehalose-phosphate synthase (UDP-forming)/trehalose-phosphatase n=1 Tax=Desulfosporosinus fructosivorans TaxID=2018669 RepID=A0A4Z0R0Q9_9FIRM|nr:bifunctional alpha,alpha-trehalose-phosphate synthase (UDP-forming)/trehalose-phosphatase [Desulfosporosinus fructosivorans]TGE35793.1 bifunctional alpha,alpha-trehalose-phosphate synthase (UDP-forming)/trehalose-phosphatase [Desulfosporosinus fructosivorans]
MRLLIVSNRLPLNGVQKDGKLHFEQSAGGLVSGLSSYLDSLKSSSAQDVEYVWIGWPGITVQDKLQTEVKNVLVDLHASPVFLSEKAMEKFYLGFCNKIIWPLFHYFPYNTIYDKDYWLQYQEVNKIFRDAVLEVIKPGDVIWVHDYHLMLLPALLREKLPQTPIGFFLHIPFPAFELYRLLPTAWGQEILRGLLGANLIGFHTQEYAQYFLRSVQRILGYGHRLGHILFQSHAVKVDTFPMGIDYQRYHSTPTGSEFGQNLNELEQLLDGYKAVLSVDRLDYSKGISHRLQGYKLFLEDNPQWREQVVLLMIVVPSRIGVEHYQLMKRKIDELVGEINGRFGTLNWTPIIYQYKFLPLDSLLAMYRQSDVALITPLRDGMNLVAKEYVAARTDQTGVLILSEMAGAAKELGEALIVNPNNIEAIAEALQQALTMPETEQIRRNQVMQQRLKGNDVVRWSGNFIQKLLQLQKEQFRALPLDRHKQTLKADFHQADKRLLLLDYDGTLVPFADSPDQAKPDQELLDLLMDLKKGNSDVVIISGRDRAILETWVGFLNITLVAEHGAWIKKGGEPWRLSKPQFKSWKCQLMPMLEMYVDKLPGSFIEEKEFSLAWHYRQADSKLSAACARELMDGLMAFTSNINLHILQGNKVLEVRNSEVTKGSTGIDLALTQDYDFILAIGDDTTDEDLFAILALEHSWPGVLPPKTYTIRVGTDKSQASYFLSDNVEVREMLQELVSGKHNN